MSQAYEMPLGAMMPMVRVLSRTIEEHMGYAKADILGEVMQEVAALRAELADLRADLQQHQTILRYQPRTRTRAERISAAEPNCPCGIPRFMLQEAWRLLSEEGARIEDVSEHLRLDTAQLRRALSEYGLEMAGGEMAS